MTGHIIWRSSISKEDMTGGSQKLYGSNKKKDTLMTEGAIWKNILLFALPLMLGNIFQQLYNTVDSIVVGNFVGKEALAAVGTTDSIINTFIGFFPDWRPVRGLLYPSILARKMKRACMTPYIQQ